MKLNANATPLLKQRAIAFFCAMTESWQWLYGRSICPKILAGKREAQRKCHAPTETTDTVTLLRLSAKIDESLCRKELRQRDGK